MPTRVPMRPETKQPAPPPPAWHSVPSEEVVRLTGTRTSGLSSDEVRQRLKQYGPNTLPRAKGDNILKLIWRQVNSPLIYVLLAAGALAIIMGKGTDGIVVLGVVVVNTIIGFVQEYRAGKAIQALSNMLPETATVLRDDKRVTINSVELVPGDVVALLSGDKVPADVRLLTVRNLKVEEAALTGESVPAEKNTDVQPEDAVLGDRLNMAYSGSLVTYGAATAVVVGTGTATELGRISAMLSDATEIATPLTRGIAKVGRWLTIAILIVTAAMFAVGLARGFSLIDATLAAITLAVAAIPEGLPAIITIALAIGVQRMARRRAVIRRLPAVETLGSTTVICSDKTGTLTRNEMTVQRLSVAAGGVRLTGVGYAPDGAVEIVDSAAPAETVRQQAHDLLLAGLLCNDATVLLEDGKWTVHGDPTEGALVVAAHKAGLDPEATRSTHERLDAIPFESERQFMATLNGMPGGERVIHLKGAPEVVFARCTATADGSTPRTAALMAEVESLAADGMRVLAFARRAVPAGQATLAETDVEGGFTLLGLQGMTDPPRTEAIASIRACHDAGITVKMITGDHKATATAISRQLGILHDGMEAVEGGQLARMSDVELTRAVASSNVFARVAPEHKLRLVRSLQAENHVVAMTGDGVNDAPALKQSDIGVAMGITGTAVSKEAADVVLTDDNFASIAAAVEEGRRVYDNLVKSLAFILPTNIGEALILLVAVMFFPMMGDMPLLPMLPTQILWINLVATVALALPLAFEAMEPDVMRRPPRAPNAPILSGFVVRRTVIVSVLMTVGAILLFLYEFHHNTTHLPADSAATMTAYRKAQTMAVTTVVFFQIFYLLNCRSLHQSMFRIGLFANKWIFVGIALLLVLQMAFIYAPFMNVAFHSAPLAPMEVLKSVLAGMVVLPVISLDKALSNRRRAAS